ncbi:MAG TPA: TolC family protein [Elusimicrobiales bacterium]|nr:TolC family protein [Elusimicrobiales bacterium]
MKSQTTPKITKGDKTRQRILETASALMAESGPDGVSMREISAKLKITKPVLYYYFKDKDELIKAAFEEGTKHFQEIQTVIDTPGLPLERKLERILTNHLDFIKRYPDMPKCALKLMASPEKSVLSTLARDLKQRTRKNMRSMMETGSENLSRAGIDGILHLISAVIVYFMIEAREHGAASLPKSLPAHIAKIICAGAKQLKTVLVILLLTPLLARAQAADLSLDAAVGLAMKNNTSVANAERGRLIYKEKIQEYWGGLYPQLSASAQYTRNIEKSSIFFGGNKIEMGSDNAYTASLDLNQVLWAGGKVYTGIKMAGIYSDTSAEQLRAAQNGVKKAVTQLYYSVLLSRAMSDIQKETLELSKQHLSTIEAQYKQGLASDLAVLRQKVEVSNNEPAVTQNLNYYESGLLELKNLLGLEPDSEIALSGSMACAAELPGTLEELYSRAMAARPEYRLAGLQRKLALENVTLERAGHYPYLAAYASRQFQGQSNDFFPGSNERTWSLAAGLRLSLPLYAGGAVNSKIKQAGLQLDTASENLKDTGRQLKIAVKKAWLDHNEAAQRLGSQNAAVETARKALAATELRFRNGLAGQLDLNDATLALNRAQTFYTQAQYDLCSANAQLAWAVGE